MTSNEINELWRRTKEGLLTLAEIGFESEIKQFAGEILSENFYHYDCFNRDYVEENYIPREEIPSAGTVCPLCDQKVPKIGDE